MTESRLSLTILSMKYESNIMEIEGILNVARLASLAARTAPKARGVDEIVTLTLTGEEKDKVAEEMRKIGEEKNLQFFIRDSNNLRTAQAVLILGVRNKQRGVPNCGYCGYPDCAANREADGVCALCTMDLGIALGSAAGVAADNRADTRIMFSVGKAAMNLGLLPETRNACGLPLSASGKSPFFDRT